MRKLTKKLCFSAEEKLIYNKLISNDNPFTKKEHNKSGFFTCDDAVHWNHLYTYSFFGYLPSQKTYSFYEYVKMKDFSYDKALTWNRVFGVENIDRVLRMFSNFELNTLKKCFVFEK